MVFYFIGQLSIQQTVAEKMVIENLFCRQVYIDHFILTTICITMFTWMIYLLLLSLALYAIILFTTLLQSYMNALFVASYL